MNIKPYGKRRSVAGALTSSQLSRQAEAIRPENLSKLDKLTNDSKLYKVCLKYLTDATSVFKQKSVSENLQNS